MLYSAKTSFQYARPGCPQSLAFYTRLLRYNLKYRLYNLALGVEANVRYSSHKYLRRPACTKKIMHFPGCCSNIIHLLRHAQGSLQSDTHKVFCAHICGIHQMVLGRLVLLKDILRLGFSALDGGTGPIEGSNVQANMNTHAHTLT